MAVQYIHLLILNYYLTIEFMPGCTWTKFNFLFLNEPLVFLSGHR